MPKSAAQIRAEQELAALILARRSGTFLRQPESIKGVYDTAKKPQAEKK